MIKFKDYGLRSINYMLKYRNHYIGYFTFGCVFYFLAYKFRNTNNAIIRIGFAGAIAQFTTEILFHPIDVINTRTKAEIAQADIDAYKMIRRIIDKEGFIGFWRGASATYYGALLGGFIYFTTYKFLKNKLKSLEGSEKLHTFSYLASSLLGETLFLLFYYPYDLIRTRMQTMMTTWDYKGPIDGYRQILMGKFRNFKRLYVGATPSFILNLSNQSIMFTVLESMREFFLKKNNFKSITELPIHTYLFCSVTAGIVSGAATNIMEVVTIHKQVDPKFKFTHFIKEQGIRALTQGLYARMSINVFHSATLFFVVDYMSQIFDVEL